MGLPVILAAENGRGERNKRLSGSAQRQLSGSGHLAGENRPQAGFSGLARGLH
jgi:hypothetical protein